MKRWLSGLLAALTLFSLTACGGMADPAGLPGETQFEDTKVDLPAVEDPEDLEDSAEPEEGGSSTAEAPEPGAPEPPGAGDGGEAPEDAETPPEDAAGEALLPEDGTYTSKEDVALYIHTYGRLPDNFITKKEAQNLGWPGGSLEPYAPGMCIGGSRFGNYEGLLPEAKGRTYTECDIDTLGAGSRGAKRIVFSNDGLIYYTGDHYASFELLYGDESDG